MTRDSTAPPAVPPHDLLEPESLEADPAETGPLEVGSLEAEPIDAEALRPEPVIAVPEAESAPRSDRSILADLPLGEIDPSKLDPDAIKVVLRLKQHGHQAYLVGGCVRDLLLGHKPKDFDVATSAHPGEVRAIFRNCRLIGRRFRLAHVYFKGGKIIEVSTFRANPTEVEEAQAELELVQDEADAEGGEGGAAGAAEAPPPRLRDDLLITQDNVFGTAEQDARRRDFTINGLFYDVGEGRVIDYVRGRRDLEERQIRTIGDPEVRLREDPVRLLRAVRFACKLDLDLESRTYAAMEGAVEDLPRCAPPRLLEETFRLIRGGAAAGCLKLLSALDALKILLPPVHEHFVAHGPESEVQFYAFAAALDKRVRSGEPLEDAVLLAALLYPLSRSNPVTESPDEGRPSVAQVIEDLLQNLVRTSRLPRRIAERCRIILISQRTLSGERRRRGPLGSFRSHPLFRESLTVFEIAVEASGEFRTELEAWQTGSAPTPKAGAPGPAGRRRRRRRKGGPRAGAASPGPAQSGGDSEA